jgi:hypothetical protein
MASTQSCYDLIRGRAESSNASTIPVEQGRWKIYFKNKNLCAYEG